MIPPMVFRILHQNDIKTSLQRIKRLETNWQSKIEN